MHTVGTFPGEDVRGFDLGDKTGRAAYPPPIRIAASSPTQVAMGGLGCF